MTLPTRFPYAAQQQYVPLPYAPQVGDLWTENFQERNSVSYFLPQVAQSGQITTIAITSNTPGNTLTVTIDGVPVVFTAGASANASALAGETAVEAIALLQRVLANGASVATNVLTLAFTDYEDHTVTVGSSGATTLTPTTTAAVANAKLLHGMWAAKRAPSGGIMQVMGEASSITDQLAGVLFRIPGAGPDTATQALALGMNADYLPVGRPYALATRGCGIVVSYVGTAPAPLDPVYRVCTGANAGQWASSDLGVSQVTSGTVAFNATDDVGVIVDGLLPVFVPSNASNTQTAADLVVAWNGNPAYAAIATASSAAAVFTLTFLDTAAHTVVAYSPATADITGITNTTAAVPASAVLCPDFSWGRPSIVGQPNEPNRAFLLLDPA